MRQEAVDLAGLSSLLDSETKKYIEKQSVSAEHYLLFAYCQVLKASIKVGYVGTIVLTLFLGGMGGSISFGDPDPTIPFWLKLLFPLTLGGLGLLIGILAIRRLAGKGSKYVDYPGGGSAGDFILLGVSHRTSIKYVKGISGEEWEKVRNFKPDLKFDVEKRELTNLSPKKKVFVRRLERVERVFAWAILPGLILFPFFDSQGMFFLMWAWFMGGLWLFTESLKSLIEGTFGVFTAANEVDFYGWPAKFFAGFMMFISVTIFILPGFCLMLEALGIHFIASFLGELFRDLR